MGRSSEAFQLDMFAAAISTPKPEVVDKAPVSANPDIPQEFHETNNVIDLGKAKTEATATTVADPVAAPSYKDSQNKVDATRVRRTRVAAARRTVICPQTRRANQAAAEDEIAAFLAAKGASKCPTRWATGSVQTVNFNTDI